MKLLTEVIDYIIVNPVLVLGGIVVTIFFYILMKPLFLLLLGAGILFIIYKLIRWFYN
jgi:hypothetical protein